MKCYIVDDLLPEYIEKLCSENTSKEIETHIAACKKCQGKLKAMTENISKNNSEEGTTSADSAFNPFLKIQKKIKAEKIKKRILICAVIIVSLVFIFLSIGQLFPASGIPNYNTIKYSYKAKQIAKDIIAGNTEVILDGINNAADLSFGVNFSVYSNESSFYEDVNTELKKLHSEIFDGKDVKIGSYDVEYETYSYYTDYNSSTPISRENYSAYMILESSDVYITLNIYFLSYNSYIIQIGDCSDKTDTPLYAFSSYCDYYMKMLCSQYIEQYVMNESLNPSRVNPTFSLFTSFLTTDCTALPTEASVDTEYRNKMKDVLTTIFNSSETLTFNMATLQYNCDNHCFDAKAYWEILDDNGNKALITKDFYRGALGFEPKDDKETIYADEGFDAMLLKQLTEVFDK